MSLKDRAIWTADDHLILHTTIKEGGTGSGNFAHAGRPGEVGGSAGMNGATPHVSAIAQHIAQQTLANGGGSFSTHGENAPTHGYMVAEHGHERTINDLSHEAVSQAIQQYMHDEAAGLARPSVFLGTWYDKGSLYLDNSRHIIDRQTALAFAYDHKQIAVYDAGKGDTVNVMSDGLRPGESKGTRNV